MNNVKRREFIKTSLKYSILPFYFDDTGFQILKKGGIKVALQLVSVIPSCKEDIVGSLLAIAEMGYKGVEFASNFGGFYGKNPGEMKKILDDCGLACAGWHPTTSEFEQNTLQRTIDTAHELGVKYLIQAELAVKKGETDKRESWLKAADRFNAINKVCLSNGLAAGYHNHTEEWRKIGDVTGWEILFDNTDKNFVHQIDTAHCLAGGGELVNMINKYKNRTKTIHLKERGIKDFGLGEPPFGEGKCPWDEVFKACEKNGGTEWYIMERFMGETASNNEDMGGAKQYIQFMKSKKRA
jgi:sugar phosphate isomerase/epimerase